jgi:hypothetical protein
MFEILQNYRHDLEVQKCYIRAPRDYREYFEPETDFFQTNKDLPDNIQWFEMGIVERNNEHLDPVKEFQKPKTMTGTYNVRGKRNTKIAIEYEWESKFNSKTPGKWVNQMNDRDFRERCVPINGKNYAFKLKKKPDIEPPNYLRMEWIAEKLRIPHDLARQVIELFKEMEFSRKEIMKIFYSPATPYCWAGGAYKKTFGKDKGKMIATPMSTGKEIARDIESIRWLNDAISEPKIKSIWGNTDGEPISEDWIYMTEEVIETIEFGTLDEQKNDTVPDQMDVTSTAYPFALFPLQYGNEALSHEFITMIKEADFDKIKEIQSRFYAQYDALAGRYYAPKYWYLTGTQKSQAWIYIKERKEQLKNMKAKDMSEDCKICLHWIKQYGKSKFSTGIIYAFKEGKNFDLFGQIIEFNEPASNQEMQFVWSQYGKFTV